MSAAKLRSIACILLAAGHSRRFGSDKMHYPLSDSRSLLETTVAQYQSVYDQISVVVPSVNEPMLNGIEGIQLIEVNRQNRGMSNSLKAGVAATADMDGWLIALADMPYVLPATIAQISAQILVNNIVVPTFGGQQGNPVGFGKVFYDQLMGIDGDVGAKSVIQQNRGSVLDIAINDAGILHDIDRQTDIRR